MAAAPLPPSITTLLAEEVRTVEEFVTILKEEEAALVAANLDALLALVERKGKFSAHLNMLVERREAALKSCGIPSGRDGMAKWLSLADKSGQAEKLWARLLELATQARDQNILNGKLISLHFQHNQRALATLMAAADRAMTYDANGMQHGGSTGRLLGSA